MSVEMHTPKPWEFDQEGFTVQKEGAHIARVYTAHDFPCLEDDERLSIEEECLLNGLLIAAAPDLLEVAQTLRDYVSDTVQGVDLREFKSMAAEDLTRIDAAIAKATGA